MTARMRLASPLMSVGSSTRSITTITPCTFAARSTRTSFSISRYRGSSLRVRGIDVRARASAGSMSRHSANDSGERSLTRMLEASRRPRCLSK